MTSGKARTSGGLVIAAGSPSAGASPARMFEFATRPPASATGATPIDREIVTCCDGAARLNAQWAGEIARSGTIFGRRIFPYARTEALARAELLAALPAAHDFLIGASRSAAEILRQQMVLNAVHDAGEQWAAEAGNAAALQTYTELRVQLQAVTGERIAALQGIGEMPREAAGKAAEAARAGEGVPGAGAVPDAAKERSSDESLVRGPEKTPAPERSGPDLGL